MVKNRNILLVYLFGIITFGIYFIYWFISTKNEMNTLGSKIPTGILFFVPIANLYWLYKYCEGFAVNVKKDNNTILWFLLTVVVGIVMPAIVQTELNSLASGDTGKVKSIPGEPLQNPKIKPMNAKGTIPLNERI